MVRKKLAMAVLALSALQADFASALGLGNVSIRSNLNQPLNAEIRLLDTGDLDPSQIKVELASTADFGRAGVDRDYFLSNLKFAVELDGRGGGVIRITTREPVVEPYLNFILETRWPSGRLLREYAVLLDLPTFSEGASVPFVPAGSSGLATVQQQSQQQQARSAASAPTATASGDWSMPSAGPGEYRVQQNDTMGRIAARLRPAGDVSAEQTMLAIQRANPDAFIRNNVNLVKAGYILRVPTADEMKTLSAAAASQEVAAQTRAWRSGDSYAPGSSGDAAAPQLDARASTETSAEGGYSEKARLSIATPGDSARKAPGEGAASSGAGTDALRNELQGAQEGLESARRDNTELQSRLDSMERQVATLQKLISLKDEQLAGLQAQGQQQIAAAAEEKPAAPAEALPAPAPEAAAPGDAETAETAAPAPTPVAPAPAKAPAAPAKPAPVAQPGLIDQLTANPLVPAAGAGVLALILGGVFLARRRKAAEEQQRTIFDANFTFEEPVPVEEEAAADFDSALISDDRVAPADDFARPAAEAPVQRVRSETGDAIAEAEIYIAYGRYQQAVDLLRSAIDAEPARADLRVKLLEVYLEMRDRDAFRRQFTELQQLGDDHAVVQVKEMLSSVDGVSGWLDELPAASAPLAPAYAPVAAAASTAAGMALAADDAVELDQELTLDEELALDDELAGGELDLDLGDDFAGDDLASADEPVPSLNQLSGFESFATPAFDEPAPAAAIADDVASFELPAESVADEGFELDLNEDELDLALDGIGGEGDGLEDLALDFATEAAPNSSGAIASDEFDLAALDEPAAADSLQFATDFGSSAATEEAGQDSLADLSADLGSLDDLDLELSGESDGAPVFEPAPINSGVEAAPFADDAFTSNEFTADAVAAEAAAEAPVLEGGDDEFDFLADADEVATKLDLARAYIDMGDTDGARDILGEVMQEGTEAQRQDAGALLSRIG